MSMTGRPDQLQHSPGTPLTADMLATAMLVLATGVLALPGCASAPRLGASVEVVKPAPTNESAVGSPQTLATSAGTADGTVRLTGGERFSDVSVQPVHLPAMPRQVAGAEAAPDGPDPALVDHFPDEFVIDGGDRGDPVHYQSFLRYGVETEDTIAEYTDDEGKNHVLPTNRVAIYAPRFAAIRTVQLPIEGFGVERMASAHRLSREVRLRTRQEFHQHQQHASAVNARSRNRASGLLGETATAGVSRLMRTGEHVKLLNAFGETGRVVAGRMDQADLARLAKSLENASAWAGDEAIRATASSAAGQEVRATPWVGAYTGVEIDQKRIGELKIVKLADRKTALSGDLITFTLRFDNTGERPLRSVRIVDNLSPRLDYIVDSATVGFTDEDDKTPDDQARGGQVTVDDNEQGSQVLVFEVDGELPGGVGGVITFQARVR